MASPITAGKKPAIETLPSDMIFEILTWLPGKPVARFKCVCKDWLSMIRSDQFRKAYRSRNRILLIYRCDEIFDEDSRVFDPYAGFVSFTRLLRFFYSPLRRLNEPRPADFRPLLDLKLNCKYNGVTQPVNGLICHSDCRSYTVDRELTIQNVFTGEKMRVPAPGRISSGFGSTVSTYHLGYALMAAEYKILRLVFHLYPYSDEVVNLPVQVQTIVLGPSGSNSSWKVIENKDSGLDRLNMNSKTLYEMVSHHEVRTYCYDGNVCWFRPKVGLILFNVHFERFQRVLFPEDLHREKRLFFRTALDGYCNIAVYVLPRNGMPECFVLYDYVSEDEDEGDVWCKEDIEFPAEIRRIAGNVAVADGEETLLLMEADQENGSGIVYGYGDLKTVERFRIGDLPCDAKPLDLKGKCYSMNHSLNHTFDTRLSCLHDSSVLYRSLNDVLTTSMW